MEHSSTAASSASTLLTALVRVVGVLLIAVGLWAIVTMVFEAVGLYRNPAGIDAMAGAIEEAAGLQRLSLSPAAAGTAGQESGRPVPADGLRPAYFLAWFMSILLFLVIGKLADWVIARGATLLSFRCPSAGEAPPPQD